MKGEEMKESVVYMSIRQTAKQTGLAESFIRAAVKKKQVPGFYSGNKFLVNVPRFLAALEEANDPNTDKK